jgi:hypothetical protein
MFRLFRFFLDLFKTKKKNTFLHHPTPVYPGYQSLETSENYCVVCNGKIRHIEFIIKKQLNVYNFCCEKCYLHWLRESAHIFGE